MAQPPPLSVGILPIVLHSVVRGSSGPHFHLIDPKTGHRIRVDTLDAETDEELSRSNLMKGYEFEKDRYVPLDDEDFAQARIDTPGPDDGETCWHQSDRADFFDSSYYLAPTVIRSSMFSSCRVMPSYVLPLCRASSSLGGSTRPRSYHGARVWLPHAASAIGSVARGALV